MPDVDLPKLKLIREGDVDGDLKKFVSAAPTGACYLARHVGKVNRHFKTDKRVLCFGQNNGFQLLLFDKDPNEPKRTIPVSAIESMVTCRVEEKQGGLLAKRMVEFCQILVRMKTGCGEKDFLMNLMPEDHDATTIQMMKDIYMHETGGKELPVTDMRKDANAPANLHDWLTQAGLKD